MVNCSLCFKELVGKESKKNKLCVSCSRDHVHDYELLEAKYEANGFCETFVCSCTDTKHKISRDF